MKYTGETLKERDESLQLNAYIPDDNLVKAVNLAIYLGRPLFITGEPGCGKTRLAEAVAYEWHGKNYKDYYVRWDIKSISKAKDGLYTFDNLQLLYDVQNPDKDEALKNKIKKKKDYVKIGKLGKVFQNSTQENPVVLLVDEIDKAPIDFPNDLLMELDEKRLYIPEIDKLIEAKHPPLVIITSNSEKEMPAAFLRRCIYHHIEFPEKELLEMILKAQKFIDVELIDLTIEAFLKIRSIQQKHNQPGDKLVSTSELIDWFKYISHIAENVVKKEELKEQLNNIKIIPFFQALLKKPADHLVFMEKIQSVSDNE